MSLGGHARNPWMIAVLVFLVVSTLVLAWPYVDGGCHSCRPPSLTAIATSNFVRVDQTAELEAYLPVKQTLANTESIPRVYVTRLPGDLAVVQDIEHRKNVFILAVLPQILRLNEAIVSQRSRARELWRSKDSGTPISNQDAKWLSSIERLYDVEPGSRRDLLRRMDVIPPSLAIAQASVESGWGTSRFAQKGNAIFGQRTFDEGGRGLDPAGLDDAHFKVKRFDSIMRSIWGYMLTLNTHPAHQEFRALRAAARARGEKANSLELAATLVNYSEERGAYVRLLRRVIQTSQLRALDQAQLAPNVGT